MKFRQNKFPYSYQKIPKNHGYLDMTALQFAKDILLGVAVGDALGVPLEFRSRESLDAHPVTEMTGHGSHNQPPGTWSDDSSLTFCLAESLAKGYNLTDIAQRFINWRDFNYWTPRGDVFDIGNTTYDSIEFLKKLISLKRFDDLEQLRTSDESKNGNGSLMRILPLVFQVHSLPLKRKFSIIEDVSNLTHPHIRSAVACLIYLLMAELIMKGFSKEEAYAKMQKALTAFLDDGDRVSDREILLFGRILRANIGDLPAAEIRSDGYVLHSLEASLWCLMQYETYEDTVLAAVNLGKDTDTTAAIAGGLAGLLYGWQSIPAHWVYLLARREDILGLADRLAKAFSPA